jgi:hypothetical protein
MTRAEKYDKLYLGAIAGFVIPIIISLIVWQFSSGHNSLAGYIQKIVDADIVTHIISLGITIFWAVLVFAVKFLL